MEMRGADGGRGSNAPFEPGAHGAHPVQVERLIRRLVFVDSSGQFDVVRGKHPRSVSSLWAEEVTIGRNGHALRQVVRDLDKWAGPLLSQLLWTDKMVRIEHVVDGWLRDVLAVVVAYG